MSRLSHLKVPKPAPKPDCGPSAQPATVTAPEKPDVPSPGPLRFAAGQLVQPTVATTAPQKPPKPKKEKVPKPPPIATPKEFVTRACGHQSAINDLQSSPCQNCQRGKKQARTAAYEAHLARNEMDFRFPLGTLGVAAWTGTEWRLTLSWPDCPRVLVVNAPAIELAWRKAKDAFLAAERPTALESPPVSG